MHKQQGLSLIELMISITIGIVLMTGVVQLFISSRVTFSTQQAMSRVQETGRLAIDIIANDIRMAGYMGCATRGATTITNGIDTSKKSNKEKNLVKFDEPLIGYIASATVNPFEDNVINGTDILVMRHAGANAIPIIEDTNHGHTTNANIDVVGPAIAKCVGDLCEGDQAIISDCTQGRLFHVTNLTGIGSGSDVRIVHSSGNTDSKLGGQQFGAGAEIIKMSTTAYYISVSPTTGERGLWQRVGNETYELFEGVENMSVRYGIAGTYYPATTVPSWGAVDSVRVELLVRSIENNVVPEPQPFTFAGVTDTPADRRMRQVFSSTVAVRNRLQ